MGKIRIVTDSLADIPAQLVQEHGITVVPLTVHFGEEEYRDGVDLTGHQFYEKLRTSEVVPRTSQPSPGAFLEVYRRLGQEGASAILSLHAAQELSGTVESARQAAHLFSSESGIPVRVIDTRFVSMAEGMVVLEVAAAAEEGEGLDALAARAEAASRNMGVYFVVDTLEYLQRNGRIGKAQAFLGGLLQFKPLLAIEGGVVTPVERVRGKAKALARMLDLVEERAGGRRVTVAVIHGDAPDEAQEIAERLRGRLDYQRVYVTALGATVGVHVGPGVVGVAYRV